MGEDEFSEDRSDEVGDGDGEEKFGITGIAVADGTMVGVAEVGAERNVGSGSANGIGGTSAAARGRGVVTVWGTGRCWISC